MFFNQQRNIGINLTTYVQPFSIANVSLQYFCNLYSARNRLIFLKSMTTKSLHPFKITQILFVKKIQTWSKSNDVAQNNSTTSVSVALFSIHESVEVSREDKSKTLYVCREYRYFERLSESPTPQLSAFPHQSRHRFYTAFSGIRLWQALPNTESGSPCRQSAEGRLPPSRCRLA